MFERLQNIFVNVLEKITNIHRTYYCIKQCGETDCGAACIATVAKQYGNELSLAKIRNMAGTDRRGTNALGLIEAAEKLGFSAKGVRAQLTDLEDGLPLPAVAHVIKDNIMHYVVIHRVMKSKIIIADPAEGLISYKKDRFNNIWSGILIIIVPTQDFNMDDIEMGLIKSIFKLVKPYKRLLAEIFVISIIYTLLGALGAFYFKFLIDTVLVNGLINTLHVISAGIIILTIFKIIMSGFRKHLLLYLSQKIDVSLILNYYQHILQLPVSFFDTRKTGEILSRLRDAAKIRRAVSGAAISVMIDSLLIVIAAVVLYIQCSLLFWITLIIVPLYLLIVRIFNKPFRNIHRREMENSALLQSYLVESVAGINTVKAFTAADESFMETEKRFIRFIKTIFKVTWMRNIQYSLQGLLTSISEVLILWIGGMEVIRGNISIGQLITFNALLAYFYDPIRNLISLQPQLQEAYVAFTRLNEVMELKIENIKENRKVNPDRLQGKIEMIDLCFSYGRRKKVLNNINFAIFPGEKIAFVGKSGSGKSTIVKLLLKYYQPDGGEILIDDYNIKDIDTGVLRTKIGYVPQDIFLFSGTIRQNIAYGSRGSELKNIITAAKKAGAHKFINKLPFRYDTPVGERGCNLSGGQKQRLAIARAMLKEPDILIFDEATSNLGIEAEEEIYTAAENVTLIKIAHHLNTISNCDKIYVLAGGRIVEQGKHEELIKKRGKYYQLWGENG